MRRAWRLGFAVLLLRSKDTSRPKLTMRIILILRLKYLKTPQVSRSFAVNVYVCICIHKCIYTDTYIIIHTTRQSGCRFCGAVSCVQVCHSLCAWERSCVCVCMACSYCSLPQPSVHCSCHPSLYTQCSSLQTLDKSLFVALGQK